MVFRFLFCECDVLSRNVLIFTPRARSPPANAFDYPARLVHFVEDAAGAAHKLAVARN